MMKPNFVDVIEYVKAGEDDPEMAEMLDLHSDGQQLLKQARFICKVLQHQAEADDDNTIAADAMRVASSRRVERMRDLNMSFSPSRKTLRERSAELRRFLVDDVGGDSEDLGTLEFAADGDTVSVSYVASDFAKMRYGKGTKKPSLCRRISRAS